MCLLCIVQGLTEFLPVSSSGHLVFIEQIFDVETEMLLLNLFLHLASLLAVIIFYRKTILNLIKKPFQPLTYKLLLSTAVTSVFALSYEFLNLNSYVFKIYGFCFLITSLILFCCHKFQKNAVVIKKATLSYFDAFAVGAVQGLAVIPGISRSGSTITTLIFLKNKEETASEYSFLMSIPIIIGGFVFELMKVENFETLFETVNLWQYLLGFLLTFVVAYVSLKITVKMLKSQKFVHFSTYLLIISIIVIAMNFI